MHVLCDIAKSYTNSSKIGTSIMSQHGPLRRRGSISASCRGKHRSFPVVQPTHDTASSLNSPPRLPWHSRTYFIIRRPTKPTRSLIFVCNSSRKKRKEGLENGEEDTLNLKDTIFCRLFPEFRRQAEHPLRQNQ